MCRQFISSSIYLQQLSPASINSYTCKVLIILQRLGSLGSVADSVVLPQPQGIDHKFAAEPLVHFP